MWEYPVIIIPNKQGKSVKSLDPLSKKVDREQKTERKTLIEPWKLWKFATDFFLNWREERLLKWHGKLLHFLLNLVIKIEEVSLDAMLDLRSAIECGHIVTSITDRGGKIAEEAFELLDNQRPNTCGNRAIPVIERKRRGPSSETFQSTSTQPPRKTSRLDTEDNENTD